MWQLPALACGERKWRLPLSDAGAARVVCALLQSEADRQLDGLAECLRQEPPLAVWAVCRDGRWRDTPPSGWIELAAWLQRVLLDGDFGPEPLGEVDPVERQRWCELAGAWRASLREESAAAQLARLMGSAPAWLSSVGPAVSLAGLRAEADWFPTWAIEPDAHPDDPADSTTRRAAVRGNGRGAGNHVQPPPSGGARSPDSEGRDSGGAEFENRLSALLPDILVRLRRHLALETAFTETLEAAKLESLRQLAYGASHEINNPLANIATRAQAMLRGESDPERRRKLTAIAGQAFRAHEMITDLMLFARPPAVDASTWDVGELLRELHERMLPDATAQGTLLQLEAPDRLAVTADRTQLAAATQALIRNALEAVASDGRVTLTGRRCSGAGLAVPEVEFSVRDTGPGIPAAIRPHLFDPFFSGREAGRGLGFGLTKAWRIAQAHGGRILVTSTTLDVSSPGSGVTSGETPSGTTISLRVPQHGIASTR